MKLSGGQQLELAALMRNGVMIPGAVAGGDLHVSIQEFAGVSLLSIERASEGYDIDPDDFRLIDDVLLHLPRKL